MIADITHALVALAPEKRWRVIEETLHWEDESPQPTEEAIQTKIIELQAEYDSKQYQRDRASAYPSTADQLDMLYHQGIDGWKSEIKKVKDAHPKPE